MPRFKDQAICIRHIDWSETSQIVALLTENHGLVRGIAKGAKRTSPSSVQRYSGGIELLTLGQTVGMIKPTAELANLTEWDLQQPYWNLRQNLKAQQLALYGADLAGAMLAEHDAHPVVFCAMRTLLGELDGGEKPQAALLRFQWKVLEDCGFKPELERDVHSGRALVKTGPFTFDAQGGGLTASSLPNYAAWKVSPATVRLLRQVRQGHCDAENYTLVRANRLLCVYVRAILDKQLPTAKYVLG